MFVDEEYRRKGIGERLIGRGKIFTRRWDINVLGNMIMLMMVIQSISS